MRRTAVRTCLVTFGGAGLVPIAPGTAGSIAAGAVLFATAWAAGPSYWTWQAVLVVGLIAAATINVGLGRWAIAHFGRDDPQPVVVDEAAGVCLTALLLPVVGPHGSWTLLAAVAAFRLFAITKPPPARQLERLPAGWGILCDDLAAGVYANLLCQVVLRVV